MPCKIARYAGYCAGVRKAVEEAHAAAGEAREKGLRCYSLGAVIHNPEAVEALRREGVIPIDRLEDAESGAMILLRYPLLGIYTRDPGALEAGVNRFYVLGSTYVTFAVMCVMTCVVRGLGFAVLPTVISLAGICGFRLVWIFTVFARFPRLYVLYLCYPISWTLTAAALYIAYLRLRGRAVRENEARYRREHPSV